MGNGGTPQRYFDQIFLCVLDPLTDSVRNLTGLTDTETDQTVLITNNHQCGELKNSTALYGFRNTVDGNHSFFKFH